MYCRPYNVGLYAASLRRRCFCEHLGFLPKDYDGTSATFDPLHDEAALKVSDIVADKFFKDTWMKTAAVNTTIYEKVWYSYYSRLKKYMPINSHFRKLLS